MSIAPVKTDIVNQTERTYKHPHRFVTPYDLWTRCMDIIKIDDQKKKNRENIIKMYEREPYKGGRDPNWGQFRGMIGKAIKQIVNILLNRKVWVRVETYEGDDLSQAWSDTITEAFHRFCIKPWCKRDQLVIAIAKDSVLWNKSFVVWPNPTCCYPIYAETDQVFFDSNTKLDLDTCEIAVVRRKMSLINIYDMVFDNEEYSDAMGWNKTAVKAMLTDFADVLKSTKDDSVTEVFKRGGITQDQRDIQVDLLWVYIREYAAAPEGHERYGNCYSLYVIPELIQGFGVSETTDYPRETQINNVAKKRDYLLFNDFTCKSVKQAVAVHSMHFMDSIHSNDSFAKQIYTTCRFYDNSMNRMIRAVLRAMRLYIRTQNKKTQERLSKDTNNEVEFLNDGDDVVQVQFKQDISGLAEISRQAVIEMNQQFGTEFQGSSQSRKGYPITKKEAELQSDQLNDSNSTDIKILVSQDRDMMEEIYRRFVNLDEYGTEDSDEYKGYKRFAEYLKKKKIPAKAWKLENVEIYSRYNQFAGSASASVVAAKGLVEATQISPASVSEERAKRDLIAAITGEENISDYMNEAMQFDSELFIIGQENSSLDNSLILPANVQVSPSDNHLLHIRGHLIDLQEKLGLANRLIQEYAQDQSYRRLLILEKVADITNSQDNKGAHIQAHIQLLSRDETRKDELAEIVPMLNQVNQQQDLLANQVRQLQEKESGNMKLMSAQDQEFQHKERMNQLDYNAKEATINQGLGKTVSQTKSRQEASIQNQQIKTAGKQQDQQLKVQDKAIDIAAKKAKVEIDIEGQQTKNAIDASKQATK